MLSKEPLNEQEKRFLGASKLFLEANPKYAEAGKILDQMSPDQQRYMINAYHLGLDDPRALRFCSHNHSVCFANTDPVLSHLGILRAAISPS